MSTGKLVTLHVHEPFTTLRSGKVPDGYSSISRSITPGTDHVNCWQETRSYPHRSTVEALLKKDEDMLGSGRKGDRINEEYLHPSLRASRSRLFYSGLYSGPDQQPDRRGKEGRRQGRRLWIASGQQHGTDRKSLSVQDRSRAELLAGHGNQSYGTRDRGASCRETSLRCDSHER